MRVVGLPTPWLTWWMDVAVDVQHKAALQPSPLAGREESGCFLY